MEEDEDLILGKPLPVLTDRPSVLTATEADKLLRKTPVDKYINEMPKCPKVGTIYVFQPLGPYSRNDWKQDGYKWKHQGAVNLPRKNPIVRKKYFYYMYEDGTLNLDFRKDVYMDLDENKEDFLAVVHYSGIDTEIEAQEREKQHLKAQTQPQIETATMLDPVTGEITSFDIAVTTEEEAILDNQPASSTSAELHVTSQLPVSPQEVLQSGKPAEKDPSVQKVRSTPVSAENLTEEKLLKLAASSDKLSVDTFNKLFKTMCKKLDSPGVEYYLVSAETNKAANKTPATEENQGETTTNLPRITRSGKQVPQSVLQDTGVEDVETNVRAGVDGADDASEDIQPSSQKKTIVVNTPKAAEVPTSSGMSTRRKSGLDTRKVDSDFISVFTRKPRHSPKRSALIPGSDSPKLVPYIIDVLSSPSTVKGTSDVVDMEDPSDTQSTQDNGNSLISNVGNDKGPPRGRGRPRKVADDMKVSADSESSKRGRGRPRKEVLETTDEAAKSDTPSRGRGRPRKVASLMDNNDADASTSTQSGENEIIIKIEVDKDTGSGTGTPRGRGRPKKMATTSETENNDIIDAASHGNKLKSSTRGSDHWIEETGADSSSEVTNKTLKATNSGRNVQKSELAKLGVFTPTIESPSLSGRRSTSRNIQKKFQCKHCDKAFSIEFLLEEHMKTHPSQLKTWVDFNKDRLDIAKAGKKKLEEDIVPVNTKEKERRPGTKSGNTVKEVYQPLKRIKLEEAVVELTEGEMFLADEDEGEEEEGMDVDEGLDDSDEDRDWEPDEEEVNKEKKQLLESLSISPKKKVKQNESVTENNKEKTKDTKHLFRSRRYKKRVIRLPKNKGGQFKCDRCERTFHSKNACQRHLILHSGEEYDCAYCDKYFKRKDYLLCHIKRIHVNIDVDKAPLLVRGSEEAEHYRMKREAERLAKEEVKPGLTLERVDEEMEEEILEEKASSSEVETGLKQRVKDKVCNVCGTKFKLKLSLEYHMKKVHGIKSKFELPATLGKKKFFECQICHKTFQSELTLQVHRVVHSKLSCTHKCPSCDAVFDSRVAFMKHKRDKHDKFFGQLMYFGYYITQDNQYKCEICEALLETLEKYHDHRTVHLNFTDLCRSCGHGFCNEIDWSNHVLSECRVKENVIECGLCNHKFTTLDARRKHLKMVHPEELEKELTCNQCGQQYDNIRDLTQHFESHDMFKIFKCDVCDKKFMEKRTLMTHRYVHRGYKTFSCDKCDKKYYTEKALERHMHWHTDDRKYPCKICNKVFVFTDELKKHEQIHMAADGQLTKDHVCMYCNRAFLVKSRLMRHMQVHKNQTTFECDICRKVFQSAGTLRQHRINKHLEDIGMKSLQPQICDVCGYTTYHKRRLAAHMESHNPDKEFQCDHCSKKFQTSQGLHNHKKLHIIPLENDGMLPYRCHWVDCGKSFIRKCYLRRHILAHVWRIKKGKENCYCFECEAKNKELNNVLPRLKNVDGEVVLDNEGMNALMSEEQDVVDLTNSEMAANTASAVNRTMVTEGGADGTAFPKIEDQGKVTKSHVNQPGELEEGEITAEGLDEEAVDKRIFGRGTGYLVCPRCFLKFPTPCKLMEHMPFHQRMYPSCEVCGKVYMEKRSLIDHMLVHSGHRPFECDTCGKKFRTKTSWRQHSFIHAEIKPFICNYCGHGFTQKGYFDEHLRRHTGERPWVCGICDKGFVSKDLLRRHSYAHTGNKPFSCSECDKSFVEKAHLLIHQRTHRNIRPFRCNKCDKAFFVRGKLNRHLAQVHKLERDGYTSFVPTRLDRGVGWRNKDKPLTGRIDIVPGQQRQTIVYVDANGEIVTMEEGPAKIKSEYVQAGDEDGFNVEGIELEEERSIQVEGLDQLPEGPLEVRTHRDASGQIHVIAQAVDTTSQYQQQLQEQHEAEERQEGEEAAIHVLSEGMASSSAEYVTTTQFVDASGQTLYTQTETNSAIGDIQQVQQVQQQAVSDDYLQIITQALAGAQAQTDNEVITESVGGESVQTEGDGQIQIYTQSTEQQIADGENFSINIGEDGTVDVGDLEKIEALRHLYENASGDQPIVIVLENQ